MLFSSIPFLYYFLPSFFLVYFLVPTAWKNRVILLWSLFFYGCGEPKLLILMMISILCGYVGGILIGTRTHKGRYLAFFSAILLGFLAYFKYANFFLETIGAVTKLPMPVLRIALPVGISFYTFQILSYLADVYLEDTKYQRNLVDFAAYVVLFPQLIAGPIVRYRHVAEELEHRTHTITQTYEGMGRFLIGLGKKVLIANATAELCDLFRASADKSVLFYWMYAVGFSLYIYFDFSGYSDMGIGLGKMMGFHFPENFNYPFLSKSITEFWRRWHMTLGSCFRDYVYIPLGGNRVSRGRWLFNVFVVWMLTGLWHGAAWNFVLWGPLFAVLLVLERLTRMTEWLPKVVTHCYVLLVVLLSFVLFYAENMAQAWNDFRGMFGMLPIPVVSTSVLYYLRSYAAILLVAMIGSTPLPKMAVQFLEKRWGWGVAVLRPCFLLAVLFLSTAYLVDGSFNPFLYFRF